MRFDGAFARGHFEKRKGTAKSKDTREVLSNIFKNLAPIYVTRNLSKDYVTIALLLGIVKYAKHFEICL